MLYLLKVRLSVDGEVVDDLIERVGFRTVSIREGRICLNEKPVFMKGFNRHEDHGMCGCAIPLQLMVQDLELMHNMGATRCSPVIIPTMSCFRISVMKEGVTKSSHLMIL